MKICTACRQMKATSDFTRSRKNTDGLDYWCRGCKKTIRDAHYRVHKAHENASSRAWKQTNATAVAEYNQRYHTERYLTDAAYRAHKSASMVEWQRAHPMAVLLQKHRRRAPAGERIRVQDVKRMHVDQDGHCFYCESALGRKFHIEHKTPLIRGGAHTLDNLCLACGTCNQRKGRKTAEEFQAIRSVRSA